MHLSLCFVLLLAGVLAAPAQQKERCPCSNDDPAHYGITVTMDPPLELPDEHVFWVPNRIRVDVPSRLHPEKVELWSGSTGAQVADTFKLVQKARQLADTKGYAHFELEVKTCPRSDNALQLGIYAKGSPRAIGINYQPFVCNKRRDALPTQSRPDPPPTK